MTLEQVVQVAAAGIAVATTGALALVLEVLFRPEPNRVRQPRQRR